jgi:hypothetical protein
MNKTILLKIKKFAIRIQLIYPLLQWTWSSCKGIPKVEDIEETLIDLVGQLIENKETLEVATGGLFARRVEEGIEFGFEVNEWFEEKKYK